MDQRPTEPHTFPGVQGGRKRIFLGLLTATCILLCLLLFLFLILPWFFPVSFLKGLSVALGVGGIILLGWLCLTLVFHIYTGRNLPFISSIRHLCIRCLLPLMEMAGRLVGIDKTIVRRSFLKVNNEFVRATATPVPADRLLLLLPHCVQWSQCRHRLLGDLAHCKQCGQCQIGQLRALAAKKGFHVAIATGGTIARQVVANLKPARIVAVACERDLTSGIQDSYPIPVYGVLNQRPNGPCRDTIAPMQALEAAMDIFLEKK